MNHFLPVAGGADQDEDKNVDYERVKDGYDGALGDGNARSLQLTFRARINIRVWIMYHD